jgi:putative methionine-R-sulfoxide reductase with GAF domain
LASDLEELAENLLVGICGMLRPASACLYVADPRLAEPRFFHRGLAWDKAPEMESLCAERMPQMSGRGGAHAGGVPAAVDGGPVLYPLKAEERLIGLLGLALDEDAARLEPDRLESLLSLVAASVSRTVEREGTARQLSHLNAYLTVSSMLAQTMDLHELLQLSLYCCMQVALAQEASVLLLDDEKEHLRFYHVEGPAKEALEGATFPAGEGVAGTVLRTGQAEVINDPYSDPRFYDKIDSKFGFPTNNMIAFPLLAGEEPVGVMEVVNKAGGASFTDEDRLLLMSIAEEIAFAIRNAKVFDYLVSTYCKQRQGQSSCKGCKRPLGSWTPCVRYRETAV